MVLTAADLDARLTLTVAVERAKGGLCWAVRVTGGPPGIASHLRLGLAGLVKVQSAVARAIDRAAAEGFRVGRARVLLADLGGVAVGVGAAGGTVWAV